MTNKEGTDMLEKLNEKKNQRVKLTKTLQAFLCDMATYIAQTVDVGTWVSVSNRLYSTICIEEQGNKHYFMTVDDEVFVNLKPDSKIYLGNHRLQVVSRDEMIHFGNNLQGIISAFEMEEEAIIQALRRSIKTVLEIEEKLNKTIVKKGDV